jgi:hypothetical protein
MTDASPGTRAAETLGGVISDLGEIAGRLPAQPGQAEAIAQLLDRLAQEVGEAARMVRAMASRPG